MYNFLKLYISSFSFFSFSFSLFLIFIKYKYILVYFQQKLEKILDSCENKDSKIWIWML